MIGGVVFRGLRSCDDDSRSSHRRLCVVAQIVAFVNDEASDTVAVVYSRGERVVLCFRGTASTKNLVTDLRATRAQCEFGGEHHEVLEHIPGVRQALPLVHSGFWAAYSTVRAQLKEILIEALREAGVNARLFCTGMTAACACVRAWNAPQ